MHATRRNESPGANIAANSSVPAPVVLGEARCRWLLRCATLEGCDLDPADDVGDARDLLGNLDRRFLVDQILHDADEDHSATLGSHADLILEAGRAGVCPEGLLDPRRALV